GAWTPRGQHLERGEGADVLPKTDKRSAVLEIAAACSSRSRWVSHAVFPTFSGSTYSDRYRSSRRLCCQNCCQCSSDREAVSRHRECPAQAGDEVLDGGSIDAHLPDECLVDATADGRRLAEPGVVECVTHFPHECLTLFGELRGGEEGNLASGWVPSMGG